MKAFTDLKQSKKLAEILPIESADMAWCNSSIKGINYTDMPSANLYTVKEMKDIFDETLVGWDKYWKLIPCWSLAALLSLLPKLYEFENDPNDGGCQPNLCKGWDNNQWHIVYRSSIYITEWYNDPIDAAFEMVVWLKENGKI